MDSFRAFAVIAFLTIFLAAFSSQTENVEDYVDRQIKDETINDPDLKDPDDKGRKKTDSNDDSNDDEKDDDGRTSPEIIAGATLGSSGALAIIILIIKCYLALRQDIHGLRDLAALIAARFMNRQQVAINHNPIALPAP